MILVIGYGNVLCGDDGLGPECVRRLAEDTELSCAAYLLEMIAAYQLTPELMEAISRADVAIFIDAAYVDRPPGTLICSELSASEKPEDQDDSAVFTHHVTPKTLLRGAESLYGHRPLAYLYTVSGGQFELGDKFSNPVEAALPTLFTSVKERITQCMNLASQKRL